MEEEIEHSHRRRVVAEEVGVVMEERRGYCIVEEEGDIRSFLKVGAPQPIYDHGLQILVVR